MESTVMETAISQGIWAVLAVFLLIYIVKSNEQRDAKQEEREKNYQTVIENLTEKFQILNQVQNDLKEIKAVSYTHLRAHETRHDLVCRLLLEKIFFNDTATTEIYTLSVVGSVRCV